jgi:hypothetical protein
VAETNGWNAEIIAEFRANQGRVGGAFEGTDTYQVTVSEIVGEERDRIFEEQARRYPGFAKYAEKTAGIRTIPVLALRRA